MAANFFQNIDFISPNITLFYEGKKRFPTMIGGIITIIICFVAIISFSNQLISYLNYEVNEIQYYRKYLEDIGTYEFSNNKESMFINVNFLDFYTKAVDINLNKVKLIAIFNSSLIINENSLSKIDHWLFDYCTKIKLQKELLNLASNDINKAVCISYYYNNKDKKYYSINDEYFQSPKIKDATLSLSIYFYKCVNNSLINQIYGDCSPENEIIDYIQNKIFLIKFNFLSHQINSEISKKPDQIIFNYLTSRIQLRETYSANYLTFSPLLIAKKVGFISDKIIINKTYTFQNYKKSSEYDSDSKYILNLFNIMFENTSQYYKYSYKTIYDIFEKVTIIIQITYYILKTVNYIFNLFIINIHIKKIIFPQKSRPDNNKILRSFSENYLFNSNNFFKSYLNNVAIPKTIEIKKNEQKLNIRQQDLSKNDLVIRQESINRLEQSNKNEPINLFKKSESGLNQIKYLNGKKFKSINFTARDFFLFFKYLI